LFLQEQIKDIIILKHKTMNRVKLEERGAWIIEVHLIRGQNLPILDWYVFFFFFLIDCFFFLIDLSMVKIFRRWTV